MHSQNWGRTLELQQQQYCRVGSGPDRLLITFVGILNLTFFNSHLHRVESSIEYPNFGYADRWWQAFDNQDFLRR
jgi:hypothetical protein